MKSEFTWSLASWQEGLDWSVRATAILAVAAAMAHLLRNRSAAVRHLVWALALGGALFVPLLKAALPGWRVPLAAADVQSMDEPGRWFAYHLSAGLPPADGLAGQSYHKSKDADTPARTSAAVVKNSDASTARIPWDRLVAWTWITGTAAWLGSILLGMISLHLLRRTSEPVPAELAAELQAIGGRLRIRRAVEGRVTDRRTIPMTWGCLRPVVLLPSEMLDWSQPRRELVLMHEMAHVKRWDYGVQLLGQMSRAVHWFNPLAWWALYQLRTEQERACDDVVINAGRSAADYAYEVVNVTTGMARRKWSHAVAMAFGRRARLSHRLQAILDASRDRQPLTLRRRAVLIGGLSTAVALSATPRWPAAQAQNPAARASVTAKAASAEDSTSVSSDSPPQGSNDSASDESLRLLARIRELIQRHSPHELDAKRLDEAAIRGMLKELHDPYSQWISRDESQELQRHLEGRIVGIGAQLAKNNEAITIVTPLPNSPAARSGLKPGDRIVGVDGQTLSDLAAVVQAIRGPQGTTVALKIERGDQQLDVIVTRDAVQLAPVQGLWLDAEGQWRYWLDADAKIAYLQITDFSQRTATETEIALAVLQSQGVRGLVLDLRGCPGGLLEESVKVASLLIKNGPVASIRGRQTPEQKLEVDGTAKYADLPLIALVDDTTASSAEVLAAAIQDRQRGIILGERTLGKGTVQAFIPVDDQDAKLRLTTGRIHRASGTPLAASPGAATWGVDPNDGYYVPLTREQREALRQSTSRRDTLGALELPESLTPEQVEQELSDPALAAALRSMAAKLGSGNFAATGRPLSERAFPSVDRDRLRRERDELRAKLQEIDQQLGEQG